MFSDWAIWAGGTVVVLVNLLAWTLVRINDIPSRGDSSSLTKRHIDPRSA